MMQKIDTVLEGRQLKLAIFYCDDLDNYMILADDVYDFGFEFEKMAKVLMEECLFDIDKIFKTEEEALIWLFQLQTIYNT